MYARQSVGEAVYTERIGKDIDADARKNVDLSAQR